MNKRFILNVFAATLLLFFSCENNPFFDDSTVIATDFDYLIVTNPTSEDLTKNATEKNSWITINANLRSTSDSDNISTENTILSNPSPFIEHTIPYIDVDSSQLQISSSNNSERAASKNIKEYYEGQGKNFSLSGSQKRGFLQHIGKYCYIWTLKDEPEASTLSEEEIKAFAEKFDSIYEKQIELCGPKYSGDSIYSNLIYPNAKLSILLFDIDNDKKDGNTYGYFQPDDFSSSPYSLTSNGMEIIYIDSYFAKQEKSKEAIFSTLVHEFNHLLNHCNKTLKLKDGNLETWYTEMLSMISEDFFYEDLGLDRVNAVQGRLADYINSGYIHGFKNWTGMKDYAIPYKYANAYTFGAFLARNYGGAKLIHEIMTNEYTNEESIVQAVNKINNKNITFEDLLQEFGCILINPKNNQTSLPSLNKEINEKITSSSDYTYHLTAIDLTTLFDGYEDYKDIKIVLSDPNSAPSVLGAYGHNVFDLSTKTRVFLKLKETLVYKTYKKNK